MVMYQLRVQSGYGNRTSHLIRKKLRWEFPTNERWVTRREEKKSRESKNGKREPQWPALGLGRSAQERIKHEAHPLPKAEVQTHCRGRGCGPVLMESTLGAMGKLVPSRWAGSHPPAGQWNSLGDDHHSVFACCWELCHRGQKPDHSEVS